jgi:hypothetical protein
MQRARGRARETLGETERKSKRERKTKSMRER